MPVRIVAFFTDALKMKELQNTFIFAICLLAFTTVVFFFKYGRERAQSKVLEAENMASQTLVFDMEKKAERRAKEAERLSKIARQSAEENMRRAQQAREMLEKSKRQSELTQMELVKNLNSQLEREADARIAAEKASKELQKQRDILKIAVEDAKSALDELKKRGAEDGGAEIARMQDLLAQREAEIERLTKRQAELERLRMEAEESQRKIEERLRSKASRPPCRVPSFCCSRRTCRRQSRPLRRSRNAPPFGRCFPFPIFRGFPANFRRAYARAGQSEKLPATFRRKTVSDIKTGKKQ